MRIYTRDVLRKGRDTSLSALRRFGELEQKSKSDGQATRSRRRKSPPPPPPSTSEVTRKITVHIYATAFFSVEKYPSSSLCDLRRHAHPRSPTRALSRPAPGAEKHGLILSLDPSLSYRGRTPYTFLVKSVVASIASPGRVGGKPSESYIRSVLPSHSFSPHAPAVALGSQLFLTDVSKTKLCIARGGELNLL